MKTLMGLAGLTMAGFMLLSCNTEVKEANYQIIPLPQEISVMDQAAPFILSNGTKIMYPEGNEKMQRNAEFLASYIKDLTGKSLAVQAGTDGKGIILQLGGNAKNPEGYQLKVPATKWLFPDLRKPEYFMASRLCVNLFRWHKEWISLYRRLKSMTILVSLTVVLIWMFPVISSRLIR